MAVVLTLTAWNAVRVWTAFAWREALAEFAPQPGPLYIGISGAVWVLVGLSVLWALEWRRAWRLRLLVGAASAYTLWYWSDRLILQTWRDNWPFTLTVNVLLLLLVFITTTYLKREAYERKSEN
jgi:hypothetical protein